MVTKTVRGCQTNAIQSEFGHGGVQCNRGREDFSASISRAKFEELNVDLFKKTMIPVAQVLKDVGMSKGQVIVRCGGCLRECGWGGGRQVGCW